MKKGNLKVLKGTYCLIIENNENKDVKIGKLNKINFKKGIYIYVGSGRNSLIPRLKRHMSKNKKLHWHIDYLLKEESINIIEILFTISNEKLECKMSKLISKSRDVVNNFGCSDCTCPSHLIYFKKKKEAIDCIERAYTHLNKEYKYLNDYYDLISTQTK